MKKHIEPKRAGLFDRMERLEDLDKLNDPLGRLDNVIDWDIFMPVLERIPKREPKGAGGRPAWPPMLMFKALIISHLYNLSDAALEFQITDRLSFKRFLGMTDADKSPDEKTIWAFREKLVRHNLMEAAFGEFRDELERRGLIANKGQMIDATFVEVPRQRNTREENETVKEGRIPAEWRETPHELRQKDTDARWTKKGDQKHYGYKNHVNVDTESKLIKDSIVTSASVHDSNVLEDLLKEGDPVTYADSAYSSPRCKGVFEAKGVTPQVVERKYRGRPLTEEQVESNHGKSKTRVRVEHVFATMRMTLRAAWNRCVGMERNRAAITMVNLVYNLVRFEQIERLGLKTW